ncbi:calcium-binding protein [Cognatishimia sp. F0-27]|uniref:calcium-binding protein n=1 Tax=Cognatishimia sp. F0-27 TaxID=2816855 RepID=UPI001D0CBD35|nr:calcium-binding protein [Cognatishimia sp. F0-27]MCC1491481.1 hypothetical protein [Cognatishimia sp. F0-27]
MVWIASVAGATDHMFDGGVEGYFQLNGLGQAAQTPVNVIPSTGAIPGLEFLSSALPGRVAFGVSNNSGRIVFEGNNLTIGTATLPNGTALPVLTGGTLTSFSYYDNSLLRSVQENGGVIDPVLFLPQNLNLTVRFDVPNIPAASLSNAVVQSYQAGSFGPLAQFFSQDAVIFNGSDGSNQIGGTLGNDLIRGNGGLDILSGGPGNDTLDGGLGTDGMDGGEGSDTYLPGPRDPSSPVGDSVSDSGTNPNDIDTLSYENATGPVVVDLNSLDGDQSAGWARGVIASGIERVVGSVFDDVLIGTDLPQSIQDTPADTLVGNAGDDTLFGLSGSDFLQGGPGFDQLVGGPNGEIRGPGPGDVAVFNASSAEIDKYILADGSILIHAPGGGVDQLFEMEFLGLTDGIFNLFNFPISQQFLRFGDNQDNTVLGSFGDDLLFGRGGNDVLSGAEGDDSMDGGAGSDQLNAGDGRDTVIGGTGNDTLRGLEGFDTLLGGADNDLLQGNAGNDLLLGEDGDDDLQGGIGFDTMNGGAGNDNLLGRDGFDSMLGGAGADVLEGNNGNDVMRGGDGNDRIEGGLGADTGEGGPGADTIIGLGGADRLVGGTGDDALNGNNANDLLFGQDGNDTLLGGFGFDSLNGGAGNDLLQAGNGFDTLLGSDGNDVLEGNSGNDRLYGGRDNDTLRGGQGADTFVLLVGADHDRISDWGTADRLELDADLLNEANPTPQDLRGYASLNGNGDLVLTFGTDSLTFNGIGGLGPILDDVTFI